MKNLLLYGGGALLAYSLFTGWKKKQALEQLDFSLAQISPSLSGGKLLLRCNLRIVNKTATALEVNGVAGVISMGSTVLGTVATTLPSQIPALATVIVPLNVDLQTWQIFNMVADFITNKAAGLTTFVFDGTVNYLGANIPVTIGYSLI